MPPGLKVRKSAHRPARTALFCPEGMPAARNHQEIEPNGTKRLRAQLCDRGLVEFGWLVLCSLKRLGAELRGKKEYAHLEEFKMPSFRSVTAFTITATLTWAGQASATGVDEASATGKGIVGGALLGAEAVILVEAAVGVKPYWAYAVGGGAGAIAGGVGGFFMEDNFSAKTNMFLLSAGMILAIPTTIAMLSATQYEPPANYVQDQAPSDEPVADPPGAGASLEQKQKQKSHKQQQKRRVAVRRTSPVAPALYSQLPPALVGLTE